MNVAILGTGYVGLTTGACLAYLGHEVTCVDPDEKKIGALQRGLAKNSRDRYADCASLARAVLAAGDSPKVRQGAAAAEQPVAPVGKATRTCPAARRCPHMSRTPAVRGSAPKTGSSPCRPRDALHGLRVHSARQTTLHWQTGPIPPARWSKPRRSDRATAAGAALVHCRR